MCGIIGYTGEKNAAGLLINGLKRLEYRGYDSAGVAFLGKTELVVDKINGRVELLEQKISGKRDCFMCGIGHTRWATHGEPSEANAHPHLSFGKRFAVVHNGIIENYAALTEELVFGGIEFASETDTEVVCHLLEYYYAGDVVGAIEKTRKRLLGSYALGILFLETPNTIYALKHDSPLIVAKTQHGAAIASDVTALLGQSNQFYEMCDDEIAVLCGADMGFFKNSRRIKKQPFEIKLDESAAHKGSFEHFMLKEIYEQPDVLKNTINPCVRNGEICFDGFRLTQQQASQIERIYIAACGSAFHAGLVGRGAIARITQIPVFAEIASEFRYSLPPLTEKTPLIVVSQSGETADSLAALRYAKSKGAKTIAVVNVLGSAIAKEADFCVYTNAGPEIAVATTKAYSCQLAALYLIALYIAKAANSIALPEYQRLLRCVMDIPQLAKTVLEGQHGIGALSERFCKAKDVFFLGRGADYAAALEASLKLKEISYIHSEAYAAGELKHGTIALIEKGTLVVALAAGRRLRDKTLSNVMEVKARGAVVFGVGESDSAFRNACDYFVELPEIEEIFSPSISVIPLQLFAYYIAKMLKLDIDKPRNLAKSVTVE